MSGTMKTHHEILVKSKKQMSCYVQQPLDIDDITIYITNDDIMNIITSKYMKICGDEIFYYFN